jgi:hypothetical protein
VIIDWDFNEPDDHTPGDDWPNTLCPGCGAEMDVVGMTCSGDAECEAGCRDTYGTEEGT